MVYSRGLGTPLLGGSGSKTRMQINLVPDLSLLAVLAIFIATSIVVRRFFVRPILAIIESREHDQRGALEVYEKAMAQFNEATAKMEEQLHLAKRQAGEVRERYRAEAASYRNAKVEETTAAASSMISEADAQLGRDVAAARNKIVRESESLARLAAERILGRPV
jgi:F0F1-type ATP synthase membrane subunit b/b'